LHDKSSSLQGLLLGVQEKVNDFGFQF